MKTKTVAFLMAAGILVLLAGSAFGQTADERIAAIKESMAKSQEALKGYEWTETTVVNYEGEEKSHSMASCKFGADGKMVKEPMGEPAEHKKRGGLRGRRAEKKMAEIKAYMGSASALIQTYVPPDPAKIQACKDAGKISVEMVEAGKRAVLRLKDYNKPGDSVGIEVDLTTNTVLSYEVASYLDSADDTVKLDVTMKQLEDGTIYPALTEMDAPAIGINVDVSNTDYHHVAK